MILAAVTERQLKAISPLLTKRITAITNNKTCTSQTQREMTRVIKDTTFHIHSTPAEQLDNEILMLTEANKK